MPVEPTTWYSGPRPACATDAMIEAGTEAIQRDWPSMMFSRAERLARIVLEAALAASPKPPIEDDAWLPIESAPKDETWVLLYFPESARSWQTDEADGRVIGFWSEEAAAWFRSEAASNALNEHGDPTHWQPIPEPPATGDADHG